jgi:hypothetical protein
LFIHFDKLKLANGSSINLEIPQHTLHNILINRKQIVEYEEQQFPPFRKWKLNGKNVDIEECLL